jgi:hypothetical protein
LHGLKLLGHLWANALSLLGLHLRLTLGLTDLLENLSGVTTHLLKRLSEFQSVLVLRLPLGLCGGEGRTDAMTELVNLLDLLRLTLHYALSCRLGRRLSLELLALHLSWLGLLDRGSYLLTRIYRNRSLYSTESIGAVYTFHIWVLLFCARVVTRRRLIWCVTRVTVSSPKLE